MIHLNIHSAQNKMCEFELYLKSLHVNFSIIAITETWFNDSNHDLYGLDGYQMVDDYRQSRRGGGVALYIRNSVVYKLRNDLDVFNENMECKFVEIDKCNFEIVVHRRLL